MPSFVIHGAVPVLVLLATRRFSTRKVWMLWPLTFLPDMDYFFGFHRATLGNVFILLPFLGVLAWSLRPKKQDKDLAEWMTIALVYLVSHLVMDTFAGGTVLLYPFSDYTYCYLAAIDVVTATNTPIFFFESCNRPGIPVVSEVYPWLSVSEAAMLAFLVPAAIIGAITTHRRRAAGRAAKESEPKP